MQHAEGAAITPLLRRPAGAMCASGHGPPSASRIDHAKANAALDAHAVTRAPLSTTPSVGVGVEVCARPSAVSGGPLAIPFACSRRRRCWRPFGGPRPAAAGRVPAARADGQQRGMGGDGPGQEPCLHAGGCRSARPSRTARACMHASDACTRAPALHASPRSPTPTRPPAHPAAPHRPTRGLDSLQAQWLASSGGAHPHARARPRLHPRRPAPVCMQAHMCTHCTTTYLAGSRRVR